MTRSPLRRALALATAAAVALVLTAPGVASAADPAVGGATQATAVALPIPDLDSSFTASNASLSSRPSASQTWNNTAWYTVTPAETVTVYIRATSLSPSGWDNGLEVWSPTARIALADDAYGVDAALKVQLNGGTAYAIGLGGFGVGDKGTATLTFSTATPGAPTGVAVTMSSGQAAVTWTAPAETAGGVTSYQVLCTAEGGTERVCATVNGAPPAARATVTNLLNGTTYTFRVRAANLIGYGAESTATAPTAFKVTPTLSVSTSPAAPAAGEPYDVVVNVAAAGRPATGTVDVTVDGATTSDLALVDGTASVTGVRSHAGTTSVAVTYSGSAAASAGSASATVTVAKRSQSISLADLPDDAVYGDGLSVGATSSLDLDVTLSASGACELTGTNLSFTGVGTCTLTAANAGNDDVLPASATVSTEVGQRPQLITLDALPSGVVHGDDPVTVHATSSDDLDITYTAAGACDLAGTALSFTGVGTCTLTAANDGTDLIGAASATVSTEVGLRPQVLTVTELPAMVYGDRVSIEASSSASLHVTIVATGSCWFDEDEHELVADGVGECTLTATQPGTPFIAPAAPVVRTQTVAKRQQTLELAELADMVYGQSATVDATSSEGLPVALEATGACVLTESGIRASGVGECTVTVTQPGTVSIAPATPVSQTLTVSKRPQTVTLSDLPVLASGGTPIVVVARSQYDLPITLTGEGACAVIDGELRAIGSGACTVTADAAGDEVTAPGSARVSGRVTGPATAITLALQLQLGAPAAGGTVTASATGLRPGTQVIFEVRSSPQVIGRATVGADGTAVITGTLPTLEAGDHELVASGTGVDGAPITGTTTFAVGATGVVTRIADRVLPPAPAAPPATPAPATPPAAAAPAAQGLASTGLDTAVAALSALAWIALGGALIVVGRAVTRRTTRHAG